LAIPMIARAAAAPSATTELSAQKEKNKGGGAKPSSNAQGKPANVNRGGGNKSRNNAGGSGNKGNKNAGGGKSGGGKSVQGGSSGKRSGDKNRSGGGKGSVSNNKPRDTNKPPRVVDYKGPRTVVGANIRRSRWNGPGRYSLHGHNYSVWRDHY